MLRRSPSMVCPHRAKVCPSKQVMLQSRKPQAMLTVLPLRTAPSQRMPLKLRVRGIFHHVIASSCLGLKG